MGNVVIFRYALDKDMLNVARTYSDNNLSQSEQCTPHALSSGNGKEHKKSWLQAIIGDSSQLGRSSSTNDLALSDSATKGKQSWLYSPFLLGRARSTNDLSERNKFSNQTVATPNDRVASVPLTHGSVTRAKNDVPTILFS